MFLKTAALKRAMKHSLKLGNLVVSNNGKDYIVSNDAGGWGVCVEIEAAPNTFKALIMEMIGELPGEGESWRYISAGEEVQKESAEMPCPRLRWQGAKERAVRTPLSLRDPQHSYSVYQTAGGEYLIARSDLTDDMFSVRELLRDEGLPADASVEDGSMGHVLYFKSSTCIYWVSDLPAEGRVGNVLFAALSGLDFAEKDWVRREEE